MKRRNAVPNHNEEELSFETEEDFADDVQENMQEEEHLVP